MRWCLLWVLGRGGSSLRTLPGLWRQRQQQAYVVTKIRVHTADLQANNRRHNFSSPSAIYVEAGEWSNTAASSRLQSLEFMELEKRLSR